MSTSPMLLVAAGCALACAWALWDVVGFHKKMTGSHEEERLEKRNDVLPQVAAAAAGGTVCSGLLVLVLARPESTGAKVLLVLLVAEALVCAGCIWVTDGLDRARHRDRIRELLTVALGAAIGSVFLASVGVVSQPGAREALGDVVDTVGAVFEGLLTLVAIVVTFIVVLGFMILLSWDEPNTPRRPPGMSRQVWNRQQRMLRRYRERYRGRGDSGSGYSGGSGDASGYDGYGGVSGDGGDGGGGD
ncbi:hypothetical protein ACOQFV_20970 [Nocardiopsis changdeensis]|uniref:TIGR02234 family membrane protein n=1 Tax=Nocardiopsis changdeensis TaxID=2831969 RepID=A0ABX8BFF7_9ACTN|nr:MULTISPECIES: hypothetical protein [Nocardiopsis]QUX20876.1 hypothetical protein KGD84_20660 [Nocardiopsis changdeensis]QYX36808.1 hypothetical protein K1J57_30115 [Nocardiopsis sp. MT53]